MYVYSPYAEAFLYMAPSFEALGGSPVFEKPARHLPRLGRGLFRPPLNAAAYQFGNTRSCEMTEIKQR